MNTRQTPWWTAALMLALTAGCGPQGPVSPEHEVQATVDGYRWPGGSWSTPVAEIRQGHVGTVLRIRGRHVTADSASREIMLTVSGFQGPGRYRLGPLEGEIYASYHTRSDPRAEPVWYTTAENSSGYVLVHAVDAHRKIISGTFDFVAERPNGVKVHVARGHFHSRYRDHWTE